MPRFQAPEHASGVFTPGGERRADEHGVIELPEDASQADLAALRVAGCREIADEPAPTAKPSRAAAAQAPETEAPAQDSTE